MKLEKWALIAEIIGAVAIVVSLIFVGLEIRNGADQTRLNTQALQMSAYQELIGEVNTLSRFYIQNLDDFVLCGHSYAGSRLSRCLRARGRAKPAQRRSAGAREHAA